MSFATCRAGHSVADALAMRHLPRDPEIVVLRPEQGLSAQRPVEEHANAKAFAGRELEEASAAAFTASGLEIGDLPGICPCPLPNCSKSWRP